MTESKVSTLFSYYTDIQDEGVRSNNNQGNKICKYHWLIISGSPLNCHTHKLINYAIVSTSNYYDWTSGSKISIEIRCTNANAIAY